MADTPRLPLPLAFDADAVEAAHAAWGCNCGPAALAAICGIGLDQVRPHVPDFEAKRYTNPTMMFAGLRALGCDWRMRRAHDWPRWGLARIQWEGPWTRPGVPMAARYRHTHWVGSCHHPRRGQGVFDVNAMESGGWVSLADWIAHLVPHILQHCVPRADGRWHITHAIEVTRLPDGRDPHEVLHG